MTVQTTIETITPKIAEQYLAMNRENRPIRRARVEQYSLQMKKGQWLFSGDPLRFDENGRLLDGQHRLLAVIDADIELEMVVMRGLETEVFKILDTGYNRQVATAIGFGKKSATNIAAATRLLWVVDVGGDPRNTRDTSLVTRTDIVDYYTENAKQIDAAIHFATQMSSMFQSGTNKSAWIAFMVLAWRINDEWAHEFHSRVHTGLDLGLGDPRYALRNLLIRNQIADRRAAQHLGFMIKTWNDWLGAKRREILTFRSQEEWPVMVTKRVYKDEE